MLNERPLSLTTHGVDDVDDVFRSMYDGADVTTEPLVLRMRNVSPLLSHGNMPTTASVSLFA